MIVVSKCPAADDASALAFTYWKYYANENAYKNRLITRPMYEFARDSLRKSLDLLSESCYINAVR